MGKAPRWAWILLTIISVGIIVGIIYQSPKKTISVFSQNWKISWEKTPEYRGKTGRRQIVLPAKIKSREENQLIIFYTCPDGSFGTMQGISADGISYMGTWQDISGHGNFHLRFSSKTTAFGWWDDNGNGQKQPMVIEQI